MINNYNVQLMLDSGAYSAWRQGIEITLDEYIAFAKPNQGFFHTIVNLDVIPGEYGRKPTSVEVKDSAKQSYSNLKKMEEHGILAMHVFHEGERWYWLERLVDEGYTYIGISARTSNGEATKRWTGDCFEIIAKCGNGHPIRTHAFGMTNIELLREFPYYSCDSTTWRMTGAFGGVHVPRLSWQERPRANGTARGQRFRYRTHWPKIDLIQRSRVVKVTEQSRRRPAHFDNVDPSRRHDYQWYVGTWKSFNLKDVGACHLLRAAVNLDTCGFMERQLKRHFPSLTREEGVAILAATPDLHQPLMDALRGAGDRQGAGAPP